MNTPQLYVKAKEHGERHTPLASLAVVLIPDTTMVTSAVIVLGGVAPKPWAAESAEFVLMGSKITPEVAAQAASAALDGAKTLQHNKYKLTLVKNIVRDSLIQLSSSTKSQLAV